MKFKKYIKESTIVTDEQSLTITEDIETPDSTSYVRDEIDKLYAPVKKMIEEKKFEEARAELDTLEQELNEFEAINAKKKLFRFPQALLNGQHDTIDALRAQIPQNESIEDMNKRCEKCNNFLNDGGTCPVCDEGEEDISDNDDNIEEELSNKEKLKKAFPELNFDKEVVTEAVGADTLNTLRDELQNLHDNEIAVKVVDILNLIPASFADELFDAIKKKLSHVKLDNEQKATIMSAAEGDVLETEDETIGGILSSAERTISAEKLKGLVTTILGIVAVIEPTPVLEIITAVVAAVPTEVVEEIMGLFTAKTENIEETPVVEELTNREKLKKAFPELNFDAPANNSDVDLDETYDEYDDEYEMDDVEQDRAHAALYGGDRMYCDCGSKLVMDEWGSYCPVCDAEEVELNRQYHDYSEEELRDMDAFNNLDDDI